jgi:hypothetical protein
MLSDAQPAVQLVLGKRREHADAPHPLRLLRTQRERPRRRAVEKKR